MALQLHNELLSIPSIRASIVEALSLSLLPSTQNRDVLGSWMVAALEEGKRSGGLGLKTWEDCTSWAAEGSSVDGRINLMPQLSTLAEFLSLSILAPASLHGDMHPPPVSSAPTAAQGAKLRTVSAPKACEASAEVEEQGLIEERWARYRVSGLTALAWLLQTIKQTPPPSVLQLLLTPEVWNALSSIDSPGGSQPPVRRATYALLSVLIDTFPNVVTDALEMLSGAVLGSCWLESEATVWETAGPAIVKFLSSK